MLLFIAIGTFVSGGKSFNDMELFAKIHAQWLGELFQMKQIPSHDTFNRILQAIRPECFNAFLLSLSNSLRVALADSAPAGSEIVAFDGKSARRSASASADIPALHTLNAWTQHNRLVLGQLATDAKSNEITAMPELLKTLELKGCVVTSDALNTQKDIAAQIVAQGADYLLPLKDNHPLARAEVGAFMEDLAALRKPDFESVEKDHGRLETRRLWQSGEVAWFEDAPKWAGLRSFALLRDTREFPDGRKQNSQRLYLSSLKVDPALAARAARAHWGIENSCHWCLDVLFGEDSSRARSRNAAVNLSALRKHCLNLLRCAEAPPFMPGISLRGKMFCASQNRDYMISIINTQTEIVNKNKQKI